jgi:DNA-binding NtrC family response regulator
MREHLGQEKPDLILLDMRLPDGSGLEFLAEQRERNEADIPCLVLTAFGDLANAVEAMKLGAVDYLKKPIDMDDLVHAVGKAAENIELNRRLDYSRHREASRDRGPQTMLGESSRIQAVRDQIDNLGKLSARTDQPPPTVLLLGETGTGKDLAARALHQASARRGRPFVQVDCAALPDDLIEAELFGHEKGAFTSAHKSRSGLIEAAEDGTLFLDEIGELPPDLQTKLLAVLERRKVRRVGRTREEHTDAWFIAATNRDLHAMVADGQFRSDLYFRLNIMTLKLPPLRERGRDAVLLARHFVAQTAARYGLPAPPLAADVEHAILGYHWPGNIRELAHLVERAVLLCGEGPIEARHLALPEPGQTAPQGPDDLSNMTLEQAEVWLIQQALEDSSGNVSQAARRLGVTRMTLRHRIQKYSIDTKQFARN